MNDLAESDKNGKPIFWNILNSPVRRVGGNDYLNLSIPPSLERKFIFLFQKTKSDSLERYMRWILKDFLIEKVDNKQKN